MKHLKSIIALFVFAAGGAFGQSAPAFGFTQTSLPITQRLCQGSQNVGSIVTIKNTAGGNQTYLCQQTGAVSLGQGAFAWLPLQLTTSTGGGSLIVASDKTATISNSITLAGTDAVTSTLPAVSSGITAAYFCGPTTGAATCANTATGGTARVIAGIATLASNSAVISGISPAFTSTTTFACTSNDQTTIGNPTKVLNTSSSSITVSNTTGASDVISYVCVGY